MIKTTPKAIHYQDKLKNKITRDGQKNVMIFWNNFDFLIIICVERDFNVILILNVLQKSVFCDYEIGTLLSAQLS